MAGKCVLLGVTGSVAAYKAVELASRLTRDGQEVITLMTAAAREFVQPLSFQSITHNQVFTDLWQRSRQFDPLHVGLAERADAVVIAPATANIIGKLARGVLDDVITCTVYATDAPVVIAPAMNDRMYNHPVVQENVKRLAALGYRLIGPATGRLASGKEGIGRLADLDDIQRAVAEVLGRSPEKSG